MTRGRINISTHHRLIPNNSCMPLGKESTWGLRFSFFHQSKFIRSNSIGAKKFPNIYENISLEFRTYFLGIFSRALFSSPLYGGSDESLHKYFSDHFQRIRWLSKKEKSSFKSTWNSHDKLPAFNERERRLIERGSIEPREYHQMENRNGIWKTVFFAF